MIIQYGTDDIQVGIYSLCISTCYTSDDRQEQLVQVSLVRDDYGYPDPGNSKALSSIHGQGSLRFVAPIFLSFLKYGSI